VESYSTDLVDDIETAFGQPFKSLTRQAASHHPLRIQIDHTLPRWTVELSSDRKNARIDTSAFDAGALLRTVRREFDDFFRSEWLPSLPAEPFTHLLLDMMSAVLFAEFANYAWYLPAARSGIMQTYRDVAGSAVSERARLESGYPSMTGVVNDFVSHLIRMTPRDRNPFEAACSFLQQDLIGGGVSIRNNPTGGSAEFSYEVAENSYPLPRTSSMVSEIAPIFLFLRHLVDPRELLIVEEPESHLHPALQRAYARVTGQLIGANLATMITTHSDYLLGQLNNVIREHSVKASATATRRARAHEAIDAAGVHAYLFRTRHGATDVSGLRVTARDGISEAEFGKVAEHLYREKAVLDRQISADDG
jgi:hypothetical protein